MKIPLLLFIISAGLFITGILIKPIFAQPSQITCTPPKPVVTSYPTPGTSPLTQDYTYPQEYNQAAQNCKKNLSVYQTAQSYTGIPWYILAGIHHVEGDCGPNQSLVSGRTIGTIEPDVGQNCSSQSNGIGQPIGMNGSCGFRSLLDTAIYAGNHLKSKIGKVPNNIQELAKALGRYNGTGNANCGRVNASMPYCPAPYEGYDHIYPFSKYDAIHQKMYLVYCEDHKKCYPPKEYTRVGALTIANILSK